MNTTIKNIYNTRCVEDSEGNMINPFPTSISYEKGMILYNIIRKTKARNTLEIGMAYGLSTLFILQAHRDNYLGNHVAIDPVERTLWKSIGLSNVQREHLGDIFRFYESYSYITLPKLLMDKEIFDFIFIDGNHTFDYALNDFFYADKLLSVDGYIMFDDTWMRSIRKVLTFIIRNRNYDIVSEYFENGLSLKRFMRIIKDKIQNPLERDYSRGCTYCVLRKISEDDRKWEYFKNF